MLALCHTRKRAEDHDVNVPTGDADHFQIRLQETGFDQKAAPNPVDKRARAGE